MSDKYNEVAHEVWVSCMKEIPDKPTITAILREAFPPHQVQGIECEYCDDRLSITKLRAEADNWQEEARQYCSNADYWREQTNALREALEPIIKSFKPQTNTEGIMRSSVIWFAEEMEKKLIANDYKGGWDKCKMRDLLVRLREETDELALSLFGEVKPEIITEAADVANFAMMIADVTRAALAAGKEGAS